MSMSTGREADISPPPPAVAAVGIHPPTAAEIFPPGQRVSGMPPPPGQNSPHGAASSRSSRSSRSNSNRSHNSNTNSSLSPTALEAEWGASSRLRSRLRKFNNPALMAPTPNLKTEEYSTGSGTEGISGRGKNCGQENEDGSTCTRRPTFGLPGDRRASRCASHKLEGHVDITSRKCESEGCNRIPSFRFQPAGGKKGGKKGRVRFCAQHKQEGMQDYHKEARGCTFTAPGEAGGRQCNRSSSFGFKGGKRIRCARHKEEGMINLNSPRCGGPECNLTPYFGQRGSTPAFCAKHKETGMVNLISKRCEEESCDRIPSYNFDAAGAKAIYCNTHKAEGMINVRHPRCADPTCKRQPSFGVPGDRSGALEYLSHEPAREHLQERRPFKNPHAVSGEDILVGRLR
eukprot:g18827.t1